MLWRLRLLETRLLHKLSPRGEVMDNYEVLGDLINNDFDHFLVIRDLNNGVSVTNSAKEVIEELINISPLKQYKSMRVLYFDSQGDLDELVMDDERKFKNFKSARHLKEKISKALEMGEPK